MRLQLRLALVIGCVSFAAFCLPASGNPAPADKDGALVPGTAQKPKPAPQAKKGGVKLAVRANSADRLVSSPVTWPLVRPRAGWPALVREARKYLGTNPTDRKKLWCATFMNLVLAKVGYAGTHSDAARSFAYYGHRISAPQVGAIAVLTRGRTGGHVGVVTGIDPNGNPIIISGNHGHRVGEGIYPRARVIAYVMPTETRALTQVADRSAPPRAPGPGIDSPIAELIAAIEAEQAHAESRPQPAAQPASQPVSQPSRPLLRAAEVQTPEPHRAVQQMPEQAGDAAQARKVDPTIADMFRLKERGASPVPPRPVKQRQMRASAEAVSPR